MESVQRGKPCYICMDFRGEGLPMPSHHVITAAIDRIVRRVVVVAVCVASLLVAGFLFVKFL